MGSPWIGSWEREERVVFPLWGQLAQGSKLSLPRQRIFYCEKKGHISKICGQKKRGGKSSVNNMDAGAGWPGVLRPSRETVSRELLPDLRGRTVLSYIARRLGKRLLF